jgi:ammonia channel protein AmtB
MTETSATKLPSASHGIEEIVGIAGIDGIAGIEGIILLALFATFVAIEFSEFIEFFTPRGKILFIDLIPVFWDIFSVSTND